MRKSSSDLLKEKVEDESKMCLLSSNVIRSVDIVISFHF